jgi:hypothetical protein
VAGGRLIPELAAMAIDSVCKMAVDQSHSTPTVGLDGHLR